MNIYKYSNETENSLENPVKDRAMSALNDIETELKSMDVKEKKRVSAELNAIYTLENDKLSKNTIHLLLATDTFLGYNTAKVIEGVLRSEGIENVQVISIGGLRTKEVEEFRLALAVLVKRLDEILPGYREKGYEIIFNLTGGFKSIQGFLQSIAPFYSDKSVYIFESNKELLTIPSLPVKLVDTEIIEKHLSTMRRLFLELDVPEESAKELPEIYWWSIEGKAALTEWGTLSFKNAKKILYGRSVYPAPSGKILISDNVIKDLNAKFDEKRKREFNITIDDLTRNLETGRQLKSSTFKKLSGKPKAKSTHECYLNSDNAERIFCHYENDILVIDEAGKHL